MGLRGPASTPTKILKMRGRTLVNARRLADEPVPPPEVPRCPTWVDADAKAGVGGAEPPALVAARAAVTTP